MCIALGFSVLIGVAFVMVHGPCFVRVVVFFFDSTRHDRTKHYLLGISLISPSLCRKKSPL